MFTNKPIQLLRLTNKNKLYNFLKNILDNETSYCRQSVFIDLTMAPFLPASSSTPIKTALY